jgi:hypothetical protein
VEAVQPTLRRATPDDADWLVALYAGEDVDPFLTPGFPRDLAAMSAAIERSGADRAPTA